MIFLVAFINVAAVIFDTFVANAAFDAAVDTAFDTAVDAAFDAAVDAAFDVASANEARFLGKFHRTKSSRATPSPRK